MKKLVMLGIILILGSTAANAQNGSFEVGPYLGAPIGDADGASFNAGANFTYYFQVIPKLKVGGSAGVDHFFGKEYEEYGYHFDKKDATFIPIAASAKFDITSRFFAGLDLGYAIGVSDAAGDGGFMARPRVGFSLPLLDVYAYYKSISYAYDWGDDIDGWDDSFTLGSIGVGASFKF